MNKDRLKSELNSLLVNYFRKLIKNKDEIIEFKNSSRRKHEKIRSTYIIRSLTVK